MLKEGLQQIGSDCKVRARFGLPNTEIVLGKYICALQSKHTSLLQGHMHVFPNYVAFACDLTGFTHFILLKLSDVSRVNKAKAFGVVPNSIEILMLGGTRYFITSFLSRNEAYHLIYDLWSIAKGIEAVKRSPPSFKDADVANVAQGPASTVSRLVHSTILPI